jgi:predicted GTPase
VRQQKLLSDGGKEISLDEAEEEEEYSEEESFLTIVELENRAQSPDVNVVVMGQAGSGKSQLVRSIVGRHAQPWEGAPAQLSDEGWWTPYKTHPKSKITWWDSKGIDSWSNNGSLRMIEAMVKLEAESFNVDFVVITINEQQMVRVACQHLSLLDCVWS